MSTQPAPPFAPTILALSLLWAVLSALVLVASVEAGVRKDAWFWALSFVVASVVAAVVFWKLVRGGA